MWGTGCVFGNWLWAEGMGSTWWPIPGVYESNSTPSPKPAVLSQAVPTHASFLGGGGLEFPDSLPLLWHAPPPPRASCLRESPQNSNGHPGTRSLRILSMRENGFSFPVMGWPLAAPIPATEGWFEEGGGSSCAWTLASIFSNKHNQPFSGSLPLPSSSLLPFSFASLQAPSGSSSSCPQDQPGMS